MTFTPPVDALNRRDLRHRDLTHRRPNRAPPTLWGNLGDWSDATEYVDAARALALRLGEAAGLGPGQRVVDLGSGAGDQLRMWVEVFGVEHVTGVESNPELAARAGERVTRWGLDSRVGVVTGKATIARWTEDIVDRMVDRVVALDSVYFLESRTAFLERCRSAVRPRGILAVTDLLLGDGVPARMAASLAPLFGVRRGDLLPEPRYRAMLAENGFDDIHVHDCTDDVLGGFSRWIRRGGHLRAAPLAVSTRLGLAMTGSAAGFFARRSGLRYVVTTARRKNE